MGYEIIFNYDQDFLAIEFLYPVSFQQTGYKNSDLHLRWRSKKFHHIPLGCDEIF